MPVSFPASFAASPTPSAAPSKSASAATSLTAKPAETAAQKFLEYANMTPAQRLQAEMLNQLGITEDQFKAMSPADQEKVMDKVRELIKQQTQNSGQQRTGLITDMSV
jgi:uncharacterized metal-binding protein